MTITNKTNIVLTILGKEVGPGKTRDYNTKYNDGLLVDSKLGSCKVYFVDGKLNCKSYGKLVAREGMGKDRKGLRKVNIFLAD